VQYFNLIFVVVLYLVIHKPRNTEISNKLHGLQVLKKYCGLSLENKVFIFINTNIFEIVFNTR